MKFQKDLTIFSGSDKLVKNGKVSEDWNFRHEISEISHTGHAGRSRDGSLSNGSPDTSLHCRNGLRSLTARTGPGPSQALCQWFSSARRCTCCLEGLSVFSRTGSTTFFVCSSEGIRGDGGLFTSRWVDIEHVRHGESAYLVLLVLSASIIAVPSSA